MAAEVVVRSICRLGQFVAQQQATVTLQRSAVDRRSSARPTLSRRTGPHALMTATNVPTTVAKMVAARITRYHPDRRAACEPPEAPATDQMRAMAPVDATRFTHQN